MDVAVVHIEARVTSEDDPFNYGENPRVYRNVKIEDLKTVVAEWEKKGRVIYNVTPVPVF